MMAAKVGCLPCTPLSVASRHCPTTSRIGGLEAARDEDFDLGLVDGLFVVTAGRPKCSEQLGCSDQAVAY
jgi:hypothetical protein